MSQLKLVYSNGSPVTTISPIKLKMLRAKLSPLPSGFAGKLAALRRNPDAWQAVERLVDRLLRDVALDDEADHCAG